MVKRTIDFLSIEFREENEGERAIDFGRRLSKEVTQSNLEMILMQARRVIEARKWEEFNFDFGNRSSWPDLAMRGFENQLQVLHRGLRFSLFL